MVNNIIIFFKANQTLVGYVGEVYKKVPNFPILVDSSLPPKIRKMRMVILTFYFIYTNHVSIYLFFETVSSLCFNDYRNRHRGRRQQNFASNYLYIVMKKALSVICYFRSSILCIVNFEILFKKKDKNIFCKAAPLPYHANIKICCVTDR